MFMDGGKQQPREQQRREWDMGLDDDESDSEIESLAAQGKNRMPWTINKKGADQSRRVDGKLKPSSFCQTRLLTT